MFPLSCCPSQELAREGNGDYGCGSMVEHVLNMSKVMGSISSTKQKGGGGWGHQEIRQIQTGRVLGKEKQQQSSQVPSTCREDVSS